MACMHATLPTYLGHVFALIKINCLKEIHLCEAIVLTRFQKETNILHLYMKRNDVTLDSQVYMNAHFFLPF